MLGPVRAEPARRRLAVMRQTGIPSQNADYQFVIVWFAGDDLGKTGRFYARGVNVSASEDADLVKRVIYHDRGI